jgi:hypothetical protein
VRDFHLTGAFLVRINGTVAATFSLPSRASAYYDKPKPPISQR